MISIYGLSDKLGNISYYDSTGQSDYSFSKPYSEKTAQLIDEEVSKLIEESYARTVKILTENKDKLTQLAEILLEKEVIFRDDLEVIFGKSAFEEELKEEKKSSKKKVQEEVVSEAVQPEETKTEKKDDNIDTAQS